MNTKINLDKKSLIVLTALAEGIKQTRSGTGIADLLDLATRLQALAKACNNTTPVTACVNGMWFEYPNTTVLVNKAAAKVEAEANRITSATMHLVEDLFGGHAAGTIAIGGIPTNDTDGDTNEGGDQEVFDDQYGRIRKYVGSIEIGHKDVRVPPAASASCHWSSSVVRVPTGMTAGLHIKKRYGK